MGKDYFSEEVSTAETGQQKDYFSEEVNTTKQTIEKPTEDYGDTENLMRVSAKDRVSALLAGGITPAVGGAKESEDILPMLNGTLGGILGAFVGKPNLGIGLGTSLGESEKQLIEKFSGSRKDLDVNDIILKGGIAAAGAKLVDLGMKTAGISMKIVPEEARAKFFDKALKAVDIGKKKLGSNFSKAITSLSEKYPNARVDLREPLTKIKEILSGEGEENLIPQLRTAVRNSPKLKKVVDNTDEAINLTLQEAIDLKNAITSSTNAITRKALKGKSTPNERVVFEVLDSIDNYITKPFKEMVDVRRAYAAGKQAYDLARPLVEPGKAVEGAIFSKPEGLFGIGGTQFAGSTQGKLALKKIMSMTKPGGKMFEAAEFAHNLNRIADTVGRLGEIAFGSAALNKLLGKDE